MLHNLEKTLVQVGVMSISPERDQSCGLSSNIHEGDVGCCVIMVVDDDEAMRSLLVDELSEYGCCVVQAGDGKEAFSQLQVRPPSLVVTDLNMKSGGFGFITRLKIAVPECRVIVVTAFGDSHTQGQAKKVGADGYFDKPVRMADLKALVAEVCPRIHCQHTRLEPKL